MFHNTRQFKAYICTICYYSSYLFDVDGELIMWGKEQQKQKAIENLKAKIHDIENERCTVCVHCINKYADQLDISIMYRYCILHEMHLRNLNRCKDWEARLE